MNNLRTATQEDTFGVLLNDDEFEHLAHAAVQDALREHKRRGDSVVVWRDGRVVTLAPEDIHLDDEPTVNADAA